MTNIISFICMYPIILIMYFVYRGQGKPNLHILFGIRYSKEWLPDEEREQLEADYRHSMNRFLLQYSLLPFITFFIPYVSINISLWMLWMMVVIVKSMAPYFKANRKLLALKKERCPQNDVAAPIYVELKQARVIRRVSWKTFALPVIVSILLAGISLVYFSIQELMVWGVTLAILAACTPVFYFAAICMDRLKTKVVSQNSDINVNYTRAQKNIYKAFWLHSCWLNNAYVAITLLILALTQTYAFLMGNVLLWGVIIYSIIELVFCMNMISKLQHLRKQYEKDMDLLSDSEEEYWIGGMFYYNPKSTKTMVDHPMGTGTTVNLATGAGKGTCVFAGLTFLSFPILCLWIILEEFSPISLAATEGTLISHHIKNEYVISTDTITELTLEDELPKISRSSGTGMEHLKKGNYRSRTDGKIKILLNPKNQYYLRVISEDTIYYLGGYDDTETLEVYEQLTED